MRDPESRSFTDAYGSGNWLFFTSPFRSIVGLLRTAASSGRLHFDWLRGQDLNPPKLKIVRNILALAQDFDCELILEGIETVETATAATELGIKFGQGYYFARPSPAQSWE